MTKVGTPNTREVSTAQVWSAARAAAGRPAGDQLLDLVGVDAGRGHRRGQHLGVVQVAALVVAGGEQGQVDGGEPLGQLVADGQAPLEGQHARARLGAGLPDRRLAVLQVDLGEGEGAEVDLDRRSPSSSARTTTSAAFLANGQR